VHNHESKCAYLHGHNYRAHFTVTPIKELDALGRVVDFSVLRVTLCAWLESAWDHRFLAWERDPVMRELSQLQTSEDARRVLSESIVWVPFNPTAENMSTYLLNVVGPRLLQNTNVRLTRVVLEETRKCSAEASL
jgi:6-pyruvoyltetrahydropterin/6-carboxytetrahydropterin synthase